MCDLIVCRTDKERAAFDAATCDVDVTWIGQNCENFQTDDAYVSKERLIELRTQGTVVMCSIWEHDENGLCADFYIVGAAA